LWTADASVLLSLHVVPLWNTKHVIIDDIGVVIGPLITQVDDILRVSLEVRQKANMMEVVSKFLVAEFSVTIVVPRKLKTGSPTYVMVIACALKLRMCASRWIVLVSGIVKTLWRTKYC